MKKLVVVAMVTAIAVAFTLAIAIENHKNASSSMERFGIPSSAAAGEQEGDASQTAEKSPHPCGGLAAIEHAAEAEKYLFIFFYKDQSEETDAMRNVFDTALDRIAERAKRVVINITDPSEKGIVDKFNVSRAPMPLVLVLAPNGAVTGGFPTKFKEQQLVEAFASPCMERCLKSLQERKLVFLCVQNKNTKLNDEAMRGVRDFKADKRFAQATEVVALDPTESVEHKFLKQLEIDPKTDEAITAFLAPPGAIIAKFKGATDKDTLVAKLTSATSSCGSGCGPGGCGQ